MSKTLAKNAEYKTRIRVRHFGGAAVNSPLDMRECEFHLRSKLVIVSQFVSAECRCQYPHQLRLFGVQRIGGSSCRTVAVVLAAHILALTPSLPA